MTTVVRKKRDNGVAVMGIDQSYSGFGVCILRPNGEYVTHLGKFTPEHYGTGIDRLNEIGAWLRRILTDTAPQIEHVVMEGYAPGAKFGREMAGELGAIVKQTLRLHPRLWDPVSYPTVISPTSLKSFVCGGQAKKEDMKLAAYKRWGVEFKSNDLCDSYCAARVAGALAWGGDITNQQLATLQKLKRHTERKE